MKRINIQKDVESRRKIATTPIMRPATKPLKTIENDAKSEEIHTTHEASAIDSNRIAEQEGERQSQGAEDNPPSPDKPIQTSTKADRATKGNTKKV